jgi:hypothetical protein
MNQLQQRIFSGRSAVTVEHSPVQTGVAERRREKRARVSKPVYVKPIQAESSDFEEVRTMKDFSRSGLYFTTERPSYSAGMQLYVVPAVGCLNFEYVGQVVRVDELPGGEYGVAVHVLRMRTLRDGTRTPTLSAFQSFALADRTTFERAKR